MAINYPTSLDTFSTKTAAQTISEDHMNDVQDSIEALEAKVGADSSAVTTSLDYLVKNFFASGRKVWIYANAAPTGWTIYTTAADCVIAAKGGSNAYNVTGGDGTLYGTWTVSGMSMAGHSHTLATDGGVTGTPGLPVIASGGYLFMNDSAGGGSPRVSQGTDSQTPAVSSAGTWRALAAVGIVISKT